MPSEAKGPRQRPVQVVVLDDNSRFALYTWRYLSSSFGFGIGNLPAYYGSDQFGSPQDPEPMPTPSGDIEVWWVPIQSHEAPGSTSEEPTNGGEKPTNGGEKPTDADEKPSAPAWRTILNTVLDRVLAPGPLREGSLHFLVDMVADTDFEPANSTPDSNRFSVQATLEILRQRRVIPGAETVWLVSSYETAPFLEKITPAPKDAGPSTAARDESAAARALTREATATRAATDDTVRWPVRAKSPQTFEHFRDRVLASTNPHPPFSAGPRPLHFLLTGAGFEMWSITSPEIHPFGLPDTAAVLERTLELLPSSDAAPSTPGEDSPSPVRKIKVEKIEKGYPVPEAYFDDPDGEKLVAAARERSLDRYWDELLTLELARKSVPRRREREYELRDAFRRVFLDYDRGYLEQALTAVQLDWEAWITTNYTRFAERAIAHDRAQNPTAQSSTPGWRVVSTSNEAKRVLREWLHEDLPREVVSRHDRVLFKLHGDLAHLTTMAIAGYDKDFSSPLTFPMDSFHMVYTAAERHLQGRIASRQADGLTEGDGVAPSTTPAHDVYWHIVGHSLQDELLCRILQRVCEPGLADAGCREAELARHHFLLVGPFALAEVEERLRSKLPNLPVGNVHHVPLTARQYIARLSASRLLDGPWPDDWRERLRLDSVDPGDSD